MTKTLIADMAAVLIEAVEAGESLADADRILRVARFGTGAIVAFRGAAVVLATQPETQNGNGRFS